MRLAAREIHFVPDENRRASKFDAREQQPPRRATGLSANFKNKSFSMQIFLACGGGSCILRLRTRFTAARE
jgi:hypothetical protein